jgi:hypothetical protein
VSRLRFFDSHCSSIAPARPKSKNRRPDTDHCFNLPLVGKALRGRWALFLIGLAAIGCGLVGTLVGMSLSDLLSIAMPGFFDQSIRLELLLYPWVMVLFLNACHSVSQRLDI